MSFADRSFAPDPNSSGQAGDVVLGDDWVAPESTVEQEMRVKRARRGLLSLKASPLTRKIIMFNLVALNLLVGGILYLNYSRDRLASQRAQSLANEALLVADVFEAQLPSVGPINMAAGDGIDVARTLDLMSLHNGVTVQVYDISPALIGQVVGRFGTGEDSIPQSPTIITDVLSAIWGGVSGLISPNAATEALESLETQVVRMVPGAIDSGMQVETGLITDGGRVFSAVVPILRADNAVGAVAVISSAGEIDALIRNERERVLQMFLVAILVSIGLSLVLASTIANPLSDLAEAAELGRDRNARKMNPGRIRIPDLTARPDEIGRLSAALRGMVAALYNRIDGNEQFAADVAHEIKNPLASLRSAVGTLRMVKRQDQREKLLDVIEHDVRRLDRLVSDISNASRLDSELVKEEEEEFNLLEMLDNLNQYLGEDARSKGIDYITDMPNDPVVIQGLEPRLAQVFVNLITNAISFCEDGDAIRVWARRRDNRVLVVVEDTGPGIPDEALTKIFKRFYSQRPEEHFGNNSGLGLAISKQILEAHGGVIWAENIRPTEADITSEPLGARFVVGLPV